MGSSLALAGTLQFGTSHPTLALAVTALVVLASGSLLMTLFGWGNRRFDVRDKVRTGLIPPTVVRQRSPGS